MREKLQRQKDEMVEQAAENGHIQAAKNIVPSREQIQQLKESVRNQDQQQTAEQQAEQQTTSSNQQQTASNSQQQTPQAAQQAVERDQQQDATASKSTQQQPQKPTEGQRESERTREIGREAGVGGAGRAVARNRQQQPAYDLTSQQDTGGVETGSGQVAAQGRTLERQVVSDVGGVESTDQVRVEREGDTLRARLTDEGEAARDEYTRERLREDVRAEYGSAQGIDITETDDGQFIGRPDFGRTGPNVAVRGQARAASATPQPARNYVNTRQEDALSGIVSGFEETTGTDVPGQGSYAGRLTAQAEGDISPLVQIGISEDNTRRARAGEQRIFERAEQGDAGAQLFTGGEIIQNIGGDVGGAVEGGTGTVLRTISDNPLDIGETQVGSSGATANAQLASAAGGLAEFPFTFAGGGVQALGVTSMSAGSAPSGDDLNTVATDAESTLATATQTQAELAVERPVEAGAILATPYGIRAARGARGSTRARVSESRLADGIPRAARKGRAEFQRFIKSERGQAKLTGRSRSRGKETVDNVGGIDPRALGKGKPEGRSAGADTSISGRAGRRGLENRQSYAADVRAARKLASETPHQDLRAVTEMPDATGGRPGSMAAVADATDPVTEAVTREGRELVEQAQQPSVDATASKPPKSQTTAELLGLESDGIATELQDILAEQEQLTDATQQTSTLQDQATESEVIPSETGAGRNDSRGGVDTRPGQGRGDRTSRRPDTVVGPDGATATSQRTGTEVTGDTHQIPGLETPQTPPTESTPGRETPQSPPRPPRMPRFDLPDGGGRGTRQPFFFDRSEVRINPISRLGDTGPSTNPFDRQRSRPDLDFGMGSGDERPAELDFGRSEPASQRADKEEDDDPFKAIFGTSRGQGSGPSELAFLGEGAGRDAGPRFPWEG